MKNEKIRENVRNIIEDIAKSKIEIFRNKQQKYVSNYAIKPHNLQLSEKITKSSLKKFLKNKKKCFENNKVCVHNFSDCRNSFRT